MTEQKTKPGRAKSITLRTLTIDEFRGKSDQMLRQHYEEVVQDKRVPMDFDWTAYVSMEARELVLCLGAFIGEKLVGYSLNFLYPAHPHHRNFAFSQNDLFFVSEPHRGNGIARMLREETKRVAAHRGFKKVFWPVKPGTAMESWLKAKGCKIEDIVFGEDL